MQKQIKHHIPYIAILSQIHIIGIYLECDMIFGLIRQQEGRRDLFFELDWKKNKTEINEIEENLKQNGKLIIRKRPD